MSDTDTTVYPPAHEFVAEAGGLTQWRAEFDGITVRRIYKGVQVRAFRGSQCVEHTLTAEQARHLGQLILEAAE